MEAGRASDEVDFGPGAEGPLIFHSVKAMAVSETSMDAIRALMVLFIGIFIVVVLVDVIPESSLKDYAYTTTANTSVGYTNGTTNVTHNLTVADIVTIAGEATPDKTLTAVVDNANTTDSYTVTAYLNGASLGSFTASNNTATTNIFTSVPFTANSVNTVLYTSDGDDELLYVNSTTVKYPSSKADTGFGTISNDLTSKTGTVYKVLILVLVVVALVVTMRYLKFGQGSPGGGTGL